VGSIEIFASWGSAKPLQEDTWILRNVPRFRTVYSTTSVSWTKSLAWNCGPHWPSWAFASHWDLASPICLRLGNGEAPFSAILWPYGLRHRVVSLVIANVSEERITSIFIVDLSEDPPAHSFRVEICSLVGGYQRFRGTYCLRRQGVNL
jgi:hypothetical protein